MNNTKMAPKTRPSKRDAILDAMLDIVVERGFHDAPMSLLAERSGASAGVIYHYFASKEEIIQALHERIRTLKVRAFFGESSPRNDPRETFIRGCLNSYAFCRKHKREMRFNEQFEHAGFGCIPKTAQEDARILDFARLFASQSKGGVLNEWPSAVHEEMTLGILTRLASHPRKLAEPVLREIVEGLWNMVRGKN